MTKNKLIQDYAKADMNLREAYAMLGAPQFVTVRANIGQALAFIERLGSLLGELKAVKECELIIEGHDIAGIEFGRCSLCDSMLNAQQNYCDTCGSKRKRR